MARLKKLNRDGDYIYIDAWRIGNEFVELLGRVGEYGGFFEAAPEDKMHKSQTTGMSCISVGLEPNRWRDVYDVLLHEVVEFAYLQMNCRLQPSGGASASQARYIFHADHEQFSEIITRAAYFLTPAIPVLYSVWSAYKKKK